MVDVPTMSSSRPYLLRAMYEWIVDNGLTPYIVVDIAVAGVEVPLEYAEDGKIVLNVAPSAADSMELGNDWVSFHARFRGTPQQVLFPASAALAIYARENGQGMMFGEPESPTEPAPESSPVPTPVPTTQASPTPVSGRKNADRSHLKIVK